MQDPEQQFPIVQQPSVRPLPPQSVVHHVHYYRPAKDPGIAVLLEILPGFFAQTFGIGNMYAGNVAGGILMMIGYWVLQLINFFLCFVIIGFATLPLTWIAFLIFCPITANSRAHRSRSAMG